MAFNVDHLLNTNSTPSQEQRDNLRNFILQLDEDISGINEQILAMQAKILILQTKRTQLVQQRRCYSSLLSPVRCLPFEIFGKIFVYATRDRPRHVLNISAVCQLWRDAALSTPMLWSTLELGRHTTRCNMDNHIDSWIERAHSYPLSLVFRKHDDFLDPVDSILTLITKHQWKSINLYSGEPTISWILRMLEFSNLEMLESFTLAPCFYSKSIPGALRYLPNLKTLSLYSYYPVTFDALPFPWRQLTSLTIRIWNDDVAMDILQACVNLEEFIRDGNDDISPGSNNSLPYFRKPHHSITLNYLRKLHTYSNDNMFLLFLKTPSIQDFAIKANESKCIYDNDFYDYIEKNGSILLKLSIAPAESKLVERIPYLQSLVELQLYDNNADDNGSIITHKILSSLVVNLEMDPSTIPLPRLERLEIICHATEEN